MRRFLLLGLGLGGCEPTPTATDTGGPLDSDTGTPAETSRTWSGTAVDGGFGARLATDGETVWVGAPFAAQVFENGVGEPLTGAEGSFFGAGLAYASAGLVIGAPGAGTITVAGSVALQETGVGGVVAATDGGWVASTPSGWVDSSGARQDLGRRPDALLWDGAVVSGAAFGTTATWRADVPSPRTTVADEAGAALLLCDTDGDGATEQVVGAPGAGMVQVGGVSIGTGMGRFGASMACGSAPGVLYVGAPAEGAEHAGAVYRVKVRGSPERILVGHALDELGTALVVAGGWVYAGAPGPAASPGAVRGVPEP